MAQRPADTAVEVSLNGKDTLEGDEKTLDELGIVSGDLVVVISPCGCPPVNQSIENTQSTCQKDNSHPTEPDQGPSCSPKKSKEGEDTSQNVSMHDLDSSSQMEMEVPGLNDTEVNRYLSEPMLCRDATAGQVPQRLALLYRDAVVQNEADAFSVVLHLMMLETGFLVQQDSASLHCDNSYRMPDGWKSPGAYRFFYSHQHSPDVLFKLILVTLGKKLVVHGYAAVPDQEDCSLQLKIDTGEYIQGNRNDAQTSYKNLPKLSQVFKDKISYRLIEDSRQLLGLPQLSGFSGLFPELKLIVLQYLDYKSLLRISETCQEFKIMARDPSLWRRLFLLEFGKRVDQSLHQDWNKLFKDRYLQRKEQQERWRSRFDMQHPYPPGNFGQPLPYVPGPPSGIIGGDYDLDPFGFRGNIMPQPLGPFRPQRPPFPGLPGNSRPPRGTGGFGGFGFGPRFF